MNDKLKKKFIKKVKTNSNVVKIIKQKKKSSLKLWAKKKRIKI